MGRMAAEGFVEAGVERRLALRWHLAVNHFPPVSETWVPVCEDVIDRLNVGADPDERVDNPVREGETLELYEVAEALHLDPWLDLGEEV